MFFAPHLLYLLALKTKEGNQTCSTFKKLADAYRKEPDSEVLSQISKSRIELQAYRPPLDFHPDVIYDVSFLLSDRVLDFLQNYKLPAHTIVPVVYTYEGIEYKYNYFFPHEDAKKYIVLYKCKYHLVMWANSQYYNWGRDLRFGTSDDIDQFRLGISYKSLVMQELVINNPAVFENDIFYMYGTVEKVYDIFFSERLKNDLLAAGFDIKFIGTYPDTFTVSEE